MRFANILALIAAIMMTTAPIAASAATWNETVHIQCMGNKRAEHTFTCHRPGEQLPSIEFNGCWHHISLQHNCGEAPVLPKPMVEEKTPPEVPEEPCASTTEDGFFVGAGYRYYAVPGSVEFHGGEALAGYRHYFSDNLYLELDGGAGGGVHSILVQDEETDKAAALATFGVHFGVRPSEYLSVSIGPEGFVTGNGTETLMGGIMGTLRLNVQFKVVRLSAFAGVGMSYHSDPKTERYWNGQPVEDVSALSAYDQANVEVKRGSDAGLDFGWTAGATLEFDLP